MPDSDTLTNARSRFGELVNRARFGRERIVLTDYQTVGEAHVEQLTLKSA